LYENALKNRPGMPWGQAAQTKARCVGEAGVIGKDRGAEERLFTTKARRPPRCTKLEDEASDSLFHERHIEVHQEANAASRQFKIGDHLGFMDAQKRIDRLDLDDNRFLTRRSMR
jgi:hypothetical protein